MQAGAASDVNRQGQRWASSDIVHAMSRLAHRLAVARGEEAADLVVRGGRVLSVFTREWLDADVAVVDGVIAGVGRYEGGETIDAGGRFVVPGFIDAHMHLESVKLLVDEFARLVLPLGTTAVVADPHEIANVLGVDGVHWLIDASAGLQLEVFFMAPSCVPASPFESPRRPLEAGDLESLMRRRRVLGLAEMMNFPGVVDGSPAELGQARPRRCGARRRARAGTAWKGAPGLRGGGHRSDHEALTVDEGRERLRAGMWLLIREASMARNLQALLPLVLEYGPGRIAFCTDDRDPEDIADDGHINGMVRDAVAAGVTPEDALLMASLHPAQWHGLRSTSARSRPATRPTCCCCPTSRDSCRTSCSSAAARSRRCPRHASRLGAPDRPRQARHRGRLRDPLAGRARSARSAWSTTRS